MKRIVSVIVVLAVCCSFVSIPLLAQQATVNRSVNLRGDPSTDNPPIGHLNKDATVTLLAKRPRAGFYHVETVDSTKGWVGVKYLTIQPQAGTPPGPGPSTTPATSAGSTGCDNSLWDHVYNPQRLIVKQKCITVTGTIVDATAGKKADGVRHEADGDTHGWLQLDPEFENLLNAGNKSAEAGNLVFEVVCRFRCRQADAVSACQAFTNPVKIPPIGSHVRVVGTYVQDTNHAKWMEIHPVTSITVLEQTAQSPAGPDVAKISTIPIALQTHNANPNVKVWVNTASGVYYCPGTRWYGATKHGGYMTQAEAQKKDQRPAYGRLCP